MAYEKPLPKMEGWTGEFYGWCKKRELRLQRCRGCRTWRHVPRPMCNRCHSWEWEWERASGRGTLFAWCVVFDPPMSSFSEDVPFAGVVVELEEGPRLVSWIAGIDPMKLRAGLAVEVDFEDVTPEVTLPRFRIAS